MQDEQRVRQAAWWWPRGLLGACARYVGAVVKQLAGIVGVCCCVSGPRRAHADAVLRFREAGESSILSLSLSRPRHSRRLSRALHRLACSSTSSHPSLPPTPAKPTNISRHHSSSFSSVTTHNIHTQPNPIRRLASAPFPTLSIIHQPSSSTSPPARAPTHRPVTRPSPDSPRPRYPYNPSRASAPFVNHLPSLPSARRHCAALHRRRSHLINHPVYRTIHQRLRVHSNSSSDQPRHHSTLQQTIHTTPPMRALKSPNLWRIL